MSNFVSIIVAVKNESKTIKSCIDSLLTLDYPEYEIIIVDNNSTDNTLDILQTYGDKIQILKHSTPGPSSCRNLGVKYSKGAFIAFIDGDCIASPNWLKELMKGFDLQDFGNIGSVGGSQKSPENDTYIGKIINLFFASVGFISDYVKSKSKGIIKVSHNPSCNVIYKREVFDKLLLGFHENLWPGEDVEFDYRVVKQGYVILYNPEAVVYHYRHHDDFKGFFDMMAKYGEMQGRLVKMHGFFRKIHFLPILSFIFFILLAVAPITGVFWILMFILAGFFYYLFKQKNLDDAIVLVILAVNAFLAWHVGFIKGFICRLE